MLIGEKYKIGADRNNIILMEKKLKKEKQITKNEEGEDVVEYVEVTTGEDVYAPIGWYPTIKILLKNLPEEIVKDNIENIEVLSNKIESLRKEILNIDFSELEKSLRHDMIASNE